MDQHTRLDLEKMPLSNDVSNDVSQIRVDRSVLTRQVTGGIPLSDIPTTTSRPVSPTWNALAEIYLIPRDKDSAEITFPKCPFPALSVAESREPAPPNGRSHTAKHAARRRRRRMARASRIAYRYPRLKQPGDTVWVIVITLGISLALGACALIVLLKSGLLLWNPS